jgi:hypothetical protein
MTTTTTKATDPKPSEAPNVVLFGLDESRKPRAARFGSSHADLAAKAAELMSLTACRVSSPGLAEIAEKLPTGRMYANGRAFVPNVRRDLYAKLIAAAATNNGNNGDGQTGEPTEKPAEAAAAGNETAPSAAEPAQPAVAHGYPRDWNDISVGHLVIASGGPTDGWWEAIVIGLEGDMLTLRWRDYPRYPKFVQHRSAVALLKPGAP